MGSSIVTIETPRFSLIQSTIDAIVVVVPDPDGPVTSTNPC